MRVETEDEGVMLSYLLGRLPEIEREQVEERIFAEDGYFERLSLLEDQLIDAFVRDELPARDRSDFERYFILSPRRREKAKFSALLSRAAKRKAPWWKPFADILRFRAPLMRVAFAGISLVALVGGSLLTYQVIRLQREVAGLASALESATKENEELRARAETQGPPPAAAPPGASPIFSLLLSPGLVRGGGVPELRLTPTAQAVRFTLKLPPSEPYSAYRGVLKDASHNELWTGTAYALRPPSDSVRLQVPARVLAPGTFYVLLQGRIAGGEYEDLATYHCKVSWESNGGLPR
jgi:hypothetical protein